MSLSPSNEVRLRVTAGSPLAEIFLIDHEFMLVQRSVGDLECDVPPGVYKIKTKLADAAAERLLLIEKSVDVDMSGELGVGSPVPIATGGPEGSRDTGTRQPRSRGVAPPSPNTAQVLLQLRTGSSEEPPAMSLHHLDGTTIEAVKQRAGGLPGEHTTTVEVDAGPYLVRRWDRWGNVLEQCVYAVPGWQTQVFASDEAGDEADDIHWSRVSVLMSQHRFDPTDPQLPLIEEARTALADERKVATDTLGELFEASDNPMLSLFGAHLMLIARDALKRDEDRPMGRLDEQAVTAPVAFDQARFNRIVDRLAHILGPGNPDVVALSTQRTDQGRGSLQPIGAPPMLWRSWVLLIAASNAMPTLVSVSTWQHTLHVLPLRPFFLWTSTDERSSVSETWARSIAESLSGRSSAPRGGTMPGVRDLAPEPGGEAEPAPRVAPGDDARRRASERLLVPRAAIDMLADGEPL